MCQQLGGDPYAIAVLPYTSFQHIADAKLTPDLLHVNRLVPDR